MGYLSHVDGCFPLGVDHTGGGHGRYQTVGANPARPCSRYSEYPGDSETISRDDFGRHGAFAEILCMGEHPGGLGLVGRLRSCGVVCDECVNDNCVSEVFTI